MCGTTQVHQTPDRQSNDHLSPQNSIGDLFRDYGEAYITAYKPSIQQIKLIRAIRVCKTPQLGGFRYTCKTCGKKHYVYKSCGHSHCMLCQSIKREQWVDKLKSKLLKVPYSHMVFTLPHQFNGLARRNEKVFYGLMMRVSWLTVREVMKGSKAGMTNVLHTFGSDMKYHLHVHALVTFGGLNINGDWQYPSCKYALAKYRVLCSTFKSIFIQELQKEILKEKVHYHHDIQAIIKESEKIRWVVHSTYPTMQTQTIEDYLAKYINRVGVTNNRLSYLKEKQVVQLQYNDYKNQELNKAAPKAYKNLEPLAAMNQILQHVLPPYFQKSRHHGLHSANEKTKASIPDKILKNGHTIRTVFEIISHLLNLKPFTCDECQSIAFDVEEITPVRPKKEKFIENHSARAPPLQKRILSSITNPEYQFSTQIGMQKS